MGRSAGRNGAKRATQTEAVENGNGNLRAVEGEGGGCVSATSPGKSRAESRIYVCAQATPLPVPSTWNRERADQLCGRRCICGY